MEENFEKEEARNAKVESQEAISEEYQEGYQVGFQDGYQEGSTVKQPEGLKPAKSGLHEAVEFILYVVALISLIICIVNYFGIFDHSMPDFEDMFDSVFFGFLSFFTFISGLLVRIAFRK